MSLRRDALLCACTGGLLAGVVERAGGRDVEVDHPTCVASGDDLCVFQLRWQLPTPTRPGFDPAPAR